MGRCKTVDFLNDLILLIIIFIIVFETSNLFRANFKICKRLKLQVGLFAVLMLVRIITGHYSSMFFEHPNITIFSEVIINILNPFLAYYIYLFTRDLVVKKKNNIVINSKYIFISLILNIIFNCTQLKFADIKMIQRLNMNSVSVYLTLGILAISLLTTLKNVKFINLNMVFVLAYIYTYIIYVSMNKFIADNKIDFTLSFILLITTNFILTLISIQDKDPLTKINNRNVFVKEVNSCLRKGINFAIINIDLDKFKEINDTYGHLAGDKALKIFSSALTIVSDELNIPIRMGGDEFMFISKHDNEYNLKLLLKKLEIIIDNFNKKNTQSFKIEYSYGYDFFYNYEDMKSFLDGIDKKMYINKKNRKIDNNKIAYYQN